jgi:SAM-dependent methyltransferase
VSRREPVDWEVEEERISARAYAAGDPIGWFDELYAAGAAGRVTLPWSRSVAHPLLTAWTQQHRPCGGGRRAVVVGCGLGADAEHLAILGHETVAFDVSPTAVALSRQRWPASTVRYLAADLLAPPAQWREAFDLVVEVITVQALPEALHPAAITSISHFVAPGGTLLVIAAVRDDRAAPDPNGPWPLRRDEVEAFAAGRLITTAIEQVPDPRPPHEPRWRATFRAPNAKA